MKKAELHQALAAAVKAAKAAGKLMRQNLHAVKNVNEATAHDIKLELDVRCQKLIEGLLARAFPAIALLGEEGNAGAEDAAARWVVDPIDGTVNYAYGIPHAAVSIALQIRTGTEYQTVIGVIFDPFQDELWTAIQGEPARCNNRIIRVSERKLLNEAIVSIGFSKSKKTLQDSLPYFGRLAQKVRKIRIGGSAALALVYVAMGRFDVYIERGISLWDIAAGGLILECAGGEFLHEPIPGYYRYRMIASNGLLRKQLPKFQ